MILLHIFCGSGFIFRLIFKEAKYSVSSGKMQVKYSDIHAPLRVNLSGKDNPLCVLINHTVGSLQSAQTER